jgi:protein SCO1/2
MAPTGRFRLVVDSANEEDQVEVTHESYPQQIKLLYFGYGQCPNVCPERLATITEALKALGDDARHIRAFYATVNPERDRNGALAKVLQDNPYITALTGGPDQVHEAMASFHISARAAGQTISHTAFIFVMGPYDGRYLTHFGSSASAEEITQRLRALIAAAPMAAWQAGWRRADAEALTRPALHGDSRNG